MFCRPSQTTISPITDAKRTGDIFALSAPKSTVTCNALRRCFGKHVARFTTGLLEDNHNKFIPDGKVDRSVFVGDVLHKVNFLGSSFCWMAELYPAVVPELQY